MKRPNPQGWIARPAHSAVDVAREVRSGDVMAYLTVIIYTLEQIMSQLSDLQDQVAATLGVEQSAIVLMNGLATKIDALVAAAGTGGVDPAALQALSDSLKASQTTLAAAVVSDARPDPAPAPAPAGGGDTGDTSAPAAPSA